MGFLNLICWGNVTRFYTWTLVFLTFVMTIAAIIYYSYELYLHGKRKQLIAWFSSGGFVLITIPISLRLIVLHLTHWNMPQVQKFVVRIAWMIPLYSVESWLSLRFRRFALQIETLRWCYESYVIYSFLYFLINVFGDEQKLVTLLREKPPERGHHPLPLRWFISSWNMGYDFFHNCKIGVLQYVVIQALLALVIVILEGFHKYDEGSFRVDRGYLYICCIASASQMWALYSLAIFYFATKEELKPWHPVGKFACVKLVVFFTWWQSVAISIAASSGMIIAKPGPENWNKDEIARGLQDYIISIEMFFFSIAFNNYFSYHDYKHILVKFKDDEDSESSYGEIEAKKPFLHAFIQSSLPDDVISDIRKYTKSGISLVTRDSGSGGVSALLVDNKLSYRADLDNKSLEDIATRICAGEDNNDERQAI